MLSKVIIYSLRPKLITGPDKRLNLEEQRDTVVKVFAGSLPSSISSRAQKFVSIAARSITASDLWGRCSG